MDTPTEPAILEEVLLVPSFHVNLISEGKLADKGLCILKNQNVTHILDRSSGSQCSQVFAQSTCTNLSYLTVYFKIHCQIGQICRTGSYLTVYFKIHCQIGQICYSGSCPSFCLSACNNTLSDTLLCSKSFAFRTSCHSDCR
jgi:hypothetical protein